MKLKDLIWQLVIEPKLTEEWSELSDETQVLILAIFDVSDVEGVLDYLKDKWENV